MTWAHVLVYSGLGLLLVLSPVLAGWIALVALAYAYFTWRHDHPRS